MILSLREIGDYLGAGVTQNSSDHDLECLSRVARLAVVLYTRNGEEDSNMRSAEVGSWCGESLLAICRGLARGAKEGVDRAVFVDCFDTWEGSPTDNSSVAKQLYGGDILDLFCTAIWQTRSDFDAMFHKTNSLDGARGQKDGKYDFIYLDAGHDYKSICQDLEAWYPKLRPGGVFAGHDYGRLFPDVVMAVDAFCQKLGRAPLVPIDSTIWVLIKPEHASSPA
jgi:hypothetical protein